MKPLIEKILEVTYIGANIICQEDNQNQITVDLSRKKVFDSIFREVYNEIRLYMENKEKSLDRHKVAATIIVSIIKSNFLQTTCTDKVFVGNYVLAAEVGLSYMMKELNKKLAEIEQQKIEVFYFPMAMSCGTDYFKIFYRNLYFANNNSKWGLNPLDIAERLFLIEYMTLEKNGINPSLLKEY